MTDEETQLWYDACCIYSQMQDDGIPEKLAVIIKMDKNTFNEFNENIIEQARKIEVKENNKNVSQALTQTNLLSPADTKQIIERLAATLIKMIQQGYPDVLISSGLDRLKKINL